MTNRYKKATAGASSSFNFYEAIICFPHFQDAVMYLLINGNVQITGKFKIVARYLIHKNFDPVELVETTFLFFFYYCYTDLIMVINWSFLFNAQFFSMTPWWACFWQLEIKGRCSSSLVFALSLLPDVLAAQHQYVSLNNGYRYRWRHSIKFQRFISFQMFARFQLMTISFLKFQRSEKKQKKKQ